MIETLIPTFLGLITLLIGYATLFQKAEDVGHARPIISSHIRQTGGGSDSLVLTNEGGRVALAVTVKLEPRVGADEHRDVLGPKGEIVVPLLGIAENEFTATIEFEDVGRHSCRAVRTYSRTNGPFVLIDGEERLKGLVRTSRTFIGRSAEQRRRIK